MRKAVRSALSSMFREADNPQATPIASAITKALTDNNTKLLHAICADLEKHESLTPRDALRQIKPNQYKKILRIELISTPPNRQTIAYLARKLGTPTFSSVAHALLLRAIHSKDSDGMRHISDAIVPNPAFKLTPPDQNAMQAIFQHLDQERLIALIKNELTYRHPNHTIIALAAQSLYDCYKIVVEPLHVTNSRLQLKGISPFVATSPIGRLLTQQAENPTVYFQFKAMLDCEDVCDRAPDVHKSDLEKIHTTLNLLAWSCFVPAKPIADECWTTTDAKRANARILSQIIMPTLYNKESPHGIRRQYYKRFLTSMHWLRSEMEDGSCQMDINARFRQGKFNEPDYNSAISRLLRDDKTQHCYILLRLLFDCYDKCIETEAHYDDMVETAAVIRLLTDPAVGLCTPIEHADWNQSKHELALKQIRRFILPLFNNGSNTDSMRHPYYQQFCNITTVNESDMEELLGSPDTSHTSLAMP